MSDQEELKELLLLNLKVNSFILTVLSNIKGFSFDSNIVLSLLKKIEEVSNRSE